MARWGAGWCFAANAISYIPLIFTVYWIQRHISLGRRFDMKRGTAWLKETGQIGHQWRLRGALLTVLATSLLCGPIITFSPVLVKEVFDSDAIHFGRAIAAFGVGGLLGATGTLAIGERVDRAMLSSYFAMGFGVLLTVIALNSSLAMLTWLLVLCGAAMTASNISANSILQSNALDRVRGRESGLYMLAMRGGLSFGNLITGAAITYLGIRGTFLINGVLSRLRKNDFSANFG